MAKILRESEEKITYIDSCLESILKNTYGIFIYQEQIMQIARTLAGYTLGEADILRRAISKKKEEILFFFYFYFINLLFIWCFIKYLFC